MRISDWSSDVCSADFQAVAGVAAVAAAVEAEGERPAAVDLAAARQAMALLGGEAAGDHRGTSRVSVARKSAVKGQSVSQRVDLGGRRSIKTKTTTELTTIDNEHQYTYTDINNH